MGRFPAEDGLLAAVLTFRHICRVASETVTLPVEDAETTQQSDSDARPGVYVSARRILKRWVSPRSRRPEKVSKQIPQESNGQQKKVATFLKSAQTSLKRWVSPRSSKLAASLPSTACETQPVAGGMAVACA